MKRIVPFFVFIALCIVPICAYANDRDLPPPTITFTGEGAVSFTPDRILVRCTVTALALTVRDAVALQASRCNDVLHKLSSLGLPDSAVKTLQYSFDAEYEYDGQKRTFKGYRAIQRFSFSTFLAQAGVLLDALAQYKDGVSLDGFAYVLNDADAVVLREAATNTAIDDARRIAERRASRLGVTLGPIVGYSPHRGDSPEYGLRSDSAARSSTPALPAGESQIRVQVDVTYEIVK